MRSTTTFLMLLLAFVSRTPVGAGEPPPPIIDMHLHALPADWFGPPPSKICVGAEFVPVDPRNGYAGPTAVDCPNPLLSSTSDDEIRDATLALLEKHNIYALTSGPLPLVMHWKEAAPERIIPSLFTPGNSPPNEEARALLESGTVRAIGEVVSQYFGIAPSDDSLAPYFEIAEEMDLPVGIHMGPGPPAVTYVGAPGFRVSLGNPLGLEPVLVEHPGLRIYVMHAGYPFLDEMVALMMAYPQVYVGVGIIDFVLPQDEFHDYLQRLVDAGLSERIMFGSDQMLWPETLEAAISRITSADFLSTAQKRDILYNNAARFLRLSDEEIARHQGAAE